MAQSAKQRAASKRNIKKAQAARKAYSKPKNMGHGIAMAHQRRANKAKRKGHVPLSLLKSRHAKLGRVIASRKGKTPKGKMPISLLRKRYAELTRILKSRSK